MIKNKPFVLIPAPKDYLWGGNRLNDDFNKRIELSPLAETWECSTHPDGQSIVGSGPFLGEKLGDVLTSNPEYLGTHPLALTGGRPELPILVKFIDALLPLSVQVHPDDEYALRIEGSLGKTEMWYVLDAKPSSSLVYGFSRDVGKEEVFRAVSDGSVGKMLNRMPVEKGDVFFIPAGTVHAIGAGCLIAEIQESSNITYRLYDYDRVDKNGQKRSLHVDKALDVACLRSSATPRQPMRILKYQRGVAREWLTRCKYFQVERMLLNTEGREMPSFQTGENSFHALLVTEGCGCIFGFGFSLNFFKGDCVFVPADSIPLQIHGKAEILDMSC